MYTMFRCCLEVINILQTYGLRIPSSNFVELSLMLKPQNSFLVEKSNAAVNCQTAPAVNMTKTVNPTHQWLLVSTMFVKTIT